MNIIDLINTPQKDLILSDQQIQQLTLEEVHQRHLMLQEILSGVLDYDIVISDTNVWLELNAVSHGDNRGNTRLMFERQLDFISKMMRHRGGKFIIMGETYEEIDRFAAVQDPVNHKEADFSDNLVYLNAAARLAKRLILSMQRENRLRIEGISSESHHAAFADPAIVRRVVELFTEGKKVLLLTNDASVAIRSIALCDDLQRINAIGDDEWNATYTLLRPMAFTFDDLRLLDNYTRQYHYIQMADGTPWMSEVQPLSASAPRSSQPLAQLTIDEYAFRQGDKHRSDNLFIKVEEQPERKQEKKQQQQQQAQQKKQQQQQQNKQQQQKSQDKKQQQQQQKKQQQPQQQSQQDKQQSQQDKQQQQPLQDKQQQQPQQDKQQSQQDKQQQQPRQEAPSEPTATPEPAAATSEPTAATSGSANATVPDGSPSGTVTESPASASPQPEAAAPAKKTQRRASARRTSKKATEAPVAAENTEQPAVEQPEAPAEPAKKPQRRTAVRKTTKKTTETAPADASADAPKATKAPKTRTTATRTKTKSATTEKKKTVRKTLAEKK
ncbi:MAG: hypothetical protein IKP84_08495 [Prevotella sp.]|nr:hypothetical protein [Prevotella sp.]